MGHQWVINLVVTDHCWSSPFVRERPPHREKDGKSGQETSPTALMWPSELLTVPFFCLMIENVFCVRQKPAWFSPEHGMALDVIVSTGSLRFHLSKSLPQSLQSVTTAIPNQNPVSVCILHVGQRSQRSHAQRTWWGALITHGSKGLEFCNPLKTIPFGNLS